MLLGFVESLLVLLQLLCTITLCIIELCEGTVPITHMLHEDPRLESQCDEGYDSRNC